MAAEIKTVSLKVNGKTRKVHIKADEILYDTLRRIGCKGVKAGCHEGACGACTVLVDGRPMMACIMRTWQVIDKEVLTIEGVGSYDEPHPFQQALVDNGAVQCGFCIPGMVLSAKALLDKKAKPTEADLKVAMDGNLCRCTGYEKIWDALQQVIDGKGGN